MDHHSLNQGGFTLPGEAGFEDLTLELARKWGADVIRDSDGTQLSESIIQSPYAIYSTLCLVRADNNWAKTNPTKLQQCCMMSQPVTATGANVTIDLLKGYSKDQFRINSDDAPKQWWQVFNRTTASEIPVDKWSFNPSTGSVEISDTTPWHQYTVNFFAYRIWEEISMYNHVTNNWGDREHLMPIDPIHPEAREQILEHLDRWLDQHPHTRVVRLTSLFYNFWWFWSDNPKQRFLVNDWGSYEFSVSPESIRQFEAAKGYRPSSEDFVNAGIYNNSYKVPSPFYRDWIDFINAFVVEFGKVCIDRIHRADKLAYVFYNDHWIGAEPYGKRFDQMGVDGIIDGIFNGFEARKVAETPAVQTREIRMHPYLFPTGVNGAPSFLPGGNPTLECKTYWNDIRRALLRKHVDRIGFGGYLNLVQNHPEFVDFITHLASEFRQLRNLVRSESPWSTGIRVGILSAWGMLRAWACRGHFNRGNPYNEVMESLSGMPVETTFLSFEDILEKGVPDSIDVLINAGHIDDAWSGGNYWRDARILSAICEWVYKGGSFIGIGEPSAQYYSHQYFQLSRLLGIERETSLTKPFERYPFDCVPHSHIGMGIDLKRPGDAIDRLFVTDANTHVLAQEHGSPTVTLREFGAGRSAYLSGFQYGPNDTRLLLQLLFWITRNLDSFAAWIPENPATDCAFFPEQNKLIVVNNTDQTQVTRIPTDRSVLELELPPFGCQFMQLD